jgi:hypothetical protein
MRAAADELLAWEALMDSFSGALLAHIAAPLMLTETLSIV